MSTDFVTSEVGKIFENTEMEFPKNMAMAAAWIMGNLKGVNLKVLDVRKHSPLADFYVIGSASNSTQASAMADTIIRQFRSIGHDYLSAEGLKGTGWILLDMGDIIIHVLEETARASYDLESLWSEAVSVEIPNGYYASLPENSESGDLSRSDRDFF